MQRISTLLAVAGVLVGFAGSEASACNHGSRSGGSFSGPRDTGRAATGTPQTGVPTTGTPSTGTPAPGNPAPGRVPTGVGSTGNGLGVAAGRRGGVPEEWFAPGSDASLAWNGTGELKNRPILVYLFDGHVNKGSFFDFAKWTEMNIFRQRKVTEETRNFHCEKLCLRTDGLMRSVAHRPELKKFLSEVEGMEPRRPMVALLDARGEVITTIDSRIPNHKWFAKELAKAQKVNTERLAKAPALEGGAKGTIGEPAPATKVEAPKAESALDILRRRRGL